MSAATIPSLFVTHGAPLFALDPGTTGPALRAWAQAHAPAEKLRGIVVLSPHWMARRPVVMTNAAPATWHDFGGFPAALYQLNYPAHGHPALAEEVLALLRGAGQDAQGDAQRPLDHGAWVPLMHMYPQADVPVVQLALPADAGPREVYALGQALAPLREQGVLLLGSGSITHNLAEFFNGGPNGPQAFVTEFCRWVEEAIQRGDRAALFDYRELAPHARRNHPTDEHFMPLYFALGAAGWGGEAPVRAEYLSREVVYNAARMDAVALY